MLKISLSRYPIVFIILLIIFGPVTVFTTQASFNLEKSVSSSSCDRHCFNGVCLNGTCVCAKGWTGAQCDHCFGRLLMNQKQSQISDGPLSYSSSTKCTWIIKNDQNFTGPLNIRLDSFQSECGWDYLYIYDGDGVDGQQLAAFSGDYHYQEISAPSGQALIYFTSDLAINLDGFNISYEFNRCLYNCSSHGNCENGICLCDDGYTGEYCQTVGCTLELEQFNGPCLNNGKCEEGKCSCPPTHHGKYCEAEKTTHVWEELEIKASNPGRASHASVLVDDVVWTIGGTSFNGVTIEQVVTFNLTSEVLTTIAIEGSDKPRLRRDHSVVRYKNKMYMFGGFFDSHETTGELWVFDMHTRVWQLENSADGNITVSIQQHYHYTTTMHI
ncbi:unnamed protein product [Auanema sp. JU1783]|nr:unnamed protein product [Auanema sp. JU1783]